VFADTAAWQWQISPPHPWEPLWKGLAKGGVPEFYLVWLNSQEKINYKAKQFIYFLPPIQFTTPPK
jgi:hypothetical protein